MKKTFLFAAALAAATLAVPASAAPVRYANVGEWAINDDGETCIMFGGFDNGIVLSVIAGDDDDLMFSLQHKNWSVQQDAIYKLEIEFDDGRPWRNITSVGSRNFDSDGPALSFFMSALQTGSDNFVADFATSNSMTVKKDGVFITKVELPKTGDAILSLLKCARKYRKTADPFRSISPDSTPTPTSVINRA